MKPRQELFAGRCRLHSGDARRGENHATPPAFRLCAAAICCALIIWVFQPMPAGAIKGNWWWQYDWSIQYCDHLSGVGHITGSFDPALVPDGMRVRIWKNGNIQSWIYATAYFNPLSNKTEIHVDYDQVKIAYNGWNLEMPWGYYGPVEGFISNNVGVVVGYINCHADQPWFTPLHEEYGLTVRTLGSEWTDNLVLFPDHTEKQRPPRACVGEPVNVINGNLMLDESDLVVAGQPVALGFSRHYNSIAADAGPLGARWSHNYQVSLAPSNTVLPNGVTNAWRTLHTGDGCCYWFKQTGSNTYAHCADNDWRLTGTNGQYAVQLGQGLRYEFDAGGVLQAIADDWGNRVTLSYAAASPAPLLTNVADHAGHSLYLNYSGSQLVRVGCAQADLCVDYGYNAGGQLTGAVTRAGADVLVRAYAYDAAANVLTQKVDEAGQVTAWTYQAGTNGVLTTQANGSLIAGQYFDTRIALNNTDYQGQNALVTNAPGAAPRIYKYVYNDVTKRLVSIQGPNGANTWLNGNVGTYFTYDNAGNVAQEKELADSTGQMNQEYTLLQRQFDGCHNVTNQAFAYNAEVTNAWLFTWDTNNNVVTSVQDPEGFRVELTYTQALPARVRELAGEGITFDTTFGYNTNGWLIAATNANGHRVAVLATR